MELDLLHICAWKMRRKKTFSLLHFTDKYICIAYHRCQLYSMCNEAIISSEIKEASSSVYIHIYIRYKYYRVCLQTYSHAKRESKKICVEMPFIVYHKAPHNTSYIPLNLIVCCNASTSFTLACLLFAYTHFLLLLLSKATSQIILSLISSQHAAAPGI